MKKLITLIVIIGIIGAGGYLFYEYWYKEYSLYNDYISFDIEHCGDSYFDGEINEPIYLRRYPDGKYVEEVRLKWENCTKEIIQKNLTIANIATFQEAIPNSIHSELMQHWKDSIWNHARAKYRESISTTSYDPNAVNFFSELLNYLEEQDKTVIYVNVIGDTDLKNLEDYSQFVRTNLEITSRYPVEPNMVPLKSNFPATLSLSNIIDQGVKKSFDNVFGEGLVDVKSYINDHSEIQKAQNELKNPGFYKGDNLASKDDIVIEINYHIRNQEVNGIPVLWSYLENEEFQNYLLGIMVDFNFDIQIPDSDKSISFDVTEDPGEAFDSSGGMRRAYTIMTAITFREYAKDITSTFGLRPPTFEEEEQL